VSPRVTPSAARPDAIVRAVVSSSPLGHHTDTGEIDRFRPGVGMIASRLDVSVVPVRLEGVDRVLHRSWHMARPGRVGVTFGAPMRLTGDDYEGLAKQWRTPCAGWPPHPCQWPREQPEVMQALCVDRVSMIPASLVRVACRSFGRPSMAESASKSCLAPAATTRQRTSSRGVSWGHHLRLLCNASRVPSSAEPTRHG